MRTTTLLGASAATIALALSGCGSSGSASPGSDFCNSAQSTKTAFNGFDALSGNPTVAQIKAASQAATAALDSLDSAAPSDISADTHKLRSALDGANSKVQSSNDVAGAETSLASIGSSDYTATANRVDAYVKSHCGFSINSSSSGSSSSSSTGGGGASSSSTDTGASSSSTDTGGSSTDTGSSSSSSQ